MKEIWKNLCANRDTILQNTALAGGIGVFMTVLVAIIKLAADRTAMFGPIGSMTGVILGGFMTLVVMVMQMAVHFPMGVRMSRTRRQMLAGLYAAGVVECLLLLALFWPLYALDTLLQGLVYRPCFAQAAEVIPEVLAVVCEWWYLVPLAVLGLPVVCMLVGCLPLLFGRRGMYVLWGVMAFAWVIPTAIMPFFDLNSDSRLAILVRPVALWLATVGPVPKIGLAAVLALALVVLAAWGVLRVDVKED